MRARRIVAAVDADGSGTVDVSELCAQLAGPGAVMRVKAAIEKRGGASGIQALSRQLKGGADGLGRQ